VTRLQLSPAVARCAEVGERSRVDRFSIAQAQWVRRDRSMAIAAV
jgi:hypothetical protein